MTEPQLVNWFYLPWRGTEETLLLLLQLGKYWGRTNHLPQSPHEELRRDVLFRPQSDCRISRRQTARKRDRSPEKVPSRRREPDTCTSYAALLEREHFPFPAHPRRAEISARFYWRFGWKWRVAESRLTCDHLTCGHGTRGDLTRDHLTCDSLARELLT